MDSFSLTSRFENMHKEQKQIINDLHDLLDMFKKPSYLSLPSRSESSPFTSTPSKDSTYGNQSYQTNNLSFDSGIDSYNSIERELECVKKRLEIIESSLSNPKKKCNSLSERALNSLAKLAESTLSIQQQLASSIEDKHLDRNLLIKLKELNDIQIESYQRFLKEL
jgi:hypothetical protein